MKLFTNPERALEKKMDQALAATDRGDFAESARLYEEVASDAAERKGPDHPIALTARLDVAAAYASLGQLDRARDLVSELIPEMERAPALGPDSRFTIHARVNLAGIYGGGGDHAKALEMLRPEAERAERVLGPDDETTFEARENLATAARGLAEPELDRILALELPSEGEPVERAVWETHLSGAREALRGCQIYRSKRVIRFHEDAAEESSEEWSVEWTIEHAAKDRFRVEQTMHTPDEGDLYDLWVVIGGHRYQNAGAWLDMTDEPEEEKETDAELDQSLVLDSFRDFLEAEPVGASIHEISGERYLRLNYSSPPAWLTKAFRNDRSTERMQLWLRCRDDQLIRIDARAISDKQQVQMTQAFSGFGEPIVISVPPSSIIGVLTSSRMGRIEHD